MKPIKIAFLLFALSYSSLIFGQFKSDTTGHAALAEKLDRSFFVYLFNEKVVEGKYVSFRQPIFKSAFVQVDEERFSIRSVKFYQNEEGFFANTNGLTFTSNFAQRIETGSINLYELVRENYNPGTYNNGMWTGGGYSRRIDNYYNVGFGNLKKANYQNLRYDLKSDPQAMLHLDKYRQQKGLSIGLYVGSAALMVAGAVSFMNTAGPGNPNLTPSYGLLFAGAGMGWIGYFVGLNKHRHIQHAISAYNGY